MPPQPPRVENNDPEDRLPYALDGLIPDDPNVPYDMIDVIKAVVDERDFFEIMPEYATNILTGFGRMGGRSVGFVANNPAVLVRWKTSCAIGVRAATVLC